MTALIGKAVEVSSARTKPFLVYGKYIYGKKGPDGLTEFKKHDGFKAFYVPRYYVPLARFGRVGLAVSTIRINAGGGAYVDSLDRSWQADVHMVGTLSGQGSRRVGSTVDCELQSQARTRQVAAS